MRAHDLARVWVAEGVCVVGYFHSPTEVEMLRVLLRSYVLLVVVLARELGRLRVPREWREAQASGWLKLDFPLATR